jgi:hypothetical protein
MFFEEDLGRDVVHWSAWRAAGSARTAVCLVGGEEFPLEHDFHAEVGECFKEKLRTSYGGSPRAILAGRQTEDNARRTGFIGNSEDLLSGAVHAFVGHDREW